MFEIAPHGFKFNVELSDWTSHGHKVDECMSLIAKELHELDANVVRIAHAEMLADQASTVNQYSIENLGSSPENPCFWQVKDIPQTMMYALLGSASNEGYNAYARVQVLSNRLFLTHVNTQVSGMQTMAVGSSLKSQSTPSMPALRPVAS